MVCYIIGIWKGDMNPSDNITTKAKQQGSSVKIDDQLTHISSLYKYAVKNKIKF